MDESTSRNVVAAAAAAEQLTAEWTGCGLWTTKDEQRVHVTSKMDGRVGKRMMYG